MRYFVMEQPIHTIPAPPVGDDMATRRVSDLSPLYAVDYSSVYGVISNRLKELLALYLPLYDFIPVVYYVYEPETGKKEQEALWRFKPPVCDKYEAVYGDDGTVSRIVYAESSAPVFGVCAPKERRSVITELSVAESILRRSMFGLTLRRVN